MIIHIVKPGETLYSIAREYGVSVEVLAINNSVSNPERLAVGQSIAVVIPTVVHTVQPGDTLVSIANDYGTTLNQLFKNNLILKGRTDIFEGQTIIIYIDREPVGSFQLGGYAYPFITEELLNLSLPFMNYLMPFTYGFTLTGELIPLDDEAMINRARVYGTRPVFHLSTLDENDVFSTENATYLLDNRQLWDVLLGNLINTMQSKGYFALDVDFEFLGKENAQKYVEFVTFLRERLNPLGYGVIVALAPKTSDDQPGLLYEGHDFKGLGEAANAVLIMTYEWGYTYGPPLAVSPIPNMRQVIEYAITRIDPAKIFEGISNYGYDFTLPYVKGESVATSLSTREAIDLAIATGSEVMYDENAMAPFFYYSKDGQSHVVWFEDARSIKAKLELLPIYGLKGALYWNLNRENNQNLTVINSLINRSPASLL